MKYRFRNGDTEPSLVEVFTGGHAVEVARFICGWLFDMRKQLGDDVWKGYICLGSGLLGELDLLTFVRFGRLSKINSLRGRKSIVCIWQHWSSGYDV